MLTIGSLFAGIGGLELGLERAGLGPVRWQVEIEPFCRTVLAKHWPNTTRYSDVREVGEGLEAVDLLCGGFPCQDLSNARTNGTRAGLDGDKSGLWREYRRIAGLIRPRWIVVENIAAWHRWLPVVRRDLDALGYASVPLELPAGAVGAPHERPRIFVVAHAHGEGEPLRAIHAEMAGVRALSGALWNLGRTPPRGFRMDDGIPRGMDRRRALGNAVVPQVAEAIGRLIVACLGQDVRRAPCHARAM